MTIFGSFRFAIMLCSGWLLLPGLGAVTPVDKDVHGFLRSEIDTTAAMRGLEMSSASTAARCLPFTASSFQADDYYTEWSPTRYGNCLRGEHHAQFTSDPVCQTVDQCNLGWTQAGDYLRYNFTITDDDYVLDSYNYEYILAVDVTVRIASANANREVFLGLYHDGELEEGVWPEILLDSPGLGWQEFKDVVWRDVKLPMKDGVSEYQLLVQFVQGSVNLCSVSVRPSRYVAVKIPALEFDDFYEVGTDSHFGSCGNGLVDAQPTSDLICQNRDKSFCNIGWTGAGEWVAYDFVTPDSEDYDIWVRVASAVPGQRIRIELDTLGWPSYDPFVDGKYSEEFDVPSLGWQEFVDLGFQIYLTDANFRLSVYFETGYVNLCAVRAEFTSHWSTGEYVPPLTFNAVEDFDEAIDTEPEVYGNCPLMYQFGVDAKQVVSDTECLESGPCHVAFTSPGEVLRYDFATEFPSGAGLVNVRLRVASHSAARTLRLELDGNVQYVTAPGNGWDSFEDIVWENVPTRDYFYFPLYITFMDGGVNLCLVEVTAAT